jgi:hypothetical protein
MKNKKFLKILISPIFSLLFLLLTKIKLVPILGTKMKFSLGVFFGPTLAKIFGISYGTGIIFFAQLIGLLFGIYKIKAIKDFFTFFPIIFAGVYFAKIFKGEKKLVFIPLICILLFIFHPIGSKVWFYSLFWLIPIFITVFKENLDRILKISIFKIYGYSLGSAFVDHGIGSVIYLYLLRIPANFWIEAIPHTILERLLIAGGISVFYLFEVAIFKIFEKLQIFEKVKFLILE